jgi:hypothetical protein
MERLRDLIPARNAAETLKKNMSVNHLTQLTDFDH